MWLMFIILVLTKLRQEDCHEFEPNLGFGVRHYLKNNHNLVKPKINLEGLLLHAEVCGTC